MGELFGNNQERANEWMRRLNKLWRILEFCQNEIQEFQNQRREAKIKSLTISEDPKFIASRM